MFKYVILLSALAMASVAAFFSVTGLGQLFHGALIPVLIMASALELGKLVTAAFLTRYWVKLTRALRIYYGVAVFILILITSAGIYGFLSNAFQQSSFDVMSTQSQVELYDGQRTSLTEDITRFQDRIDILNQQRTTQQEQYKELTDGEDWVNAGRVFQQIERSDSTINVLGDQITERRERMVRLDSLYYAASATTLETQREIGGFRFIAENFNTEVNTVVKWFIFIIIFVFDPLAVSLVIGFNYIQYHTDEKQPEKRKSVKWKIYDEGETESIQELTMDEFEEILEEDLDKPGSKLLPYMNMEIHNSHSNSKIKIGDAMKLDDDHPVKQAATEFLAGKMLMDYDKLRTNDA